MTIVGWILIVIGVLGLIGNMSGGGSLADPSPRSAGFRFFLWGAALLGGGALVFLR